MNLDLSYLRYFHEVARAESFTRASKALRVSQPTISKMVQLLEAQVGERLFDRTKRSVALTDMGKVFFERTQRIFLEIEKLKSDLEKKTTECVGEISIGASDNLCNYLFPKLIGRFQKEYPEVSFRVFNGSSTDIKTEILDGKSEIGVFYTEPDEPTFNSTKIGFVEFTLVIAPQKSGAPQIKWSASRIAGVPFISSRVADYERPFPVNRMLNSLGIKPQMGIQTNSQETQKRHAIEGQGFTVLPRFMVQEELKKNQLVEIPVSKVIGSNVYWVTRKNKTLSRQATVFSEYLKNSKVF